MSKSKTQTTENYSCLFCGKTFAAKDVLFADVIPAGQSDARDIVLQKTYNSYINAPTQVPTQLLHHWTQLSKDACHYYEGESIPDTIHVCRHDGELMMDDAKVEDDSSFAGYSALDSLESRDQMNEANGQHPQTPQEKLRDKVFKGIAKDQMMVLNKRICPHCHCAVPRGIGQYPVYRISMLGGSSSGKTTFMLLAASQMTNLDYSCNTMDQELELASGDVIGESEDYFQMMYQKHIKTQKNATPREDAKPVFPMVLQLTPHAETQKPPFFLVLQDFPGEAMQNKTHLINSPALAESQGAIFMVDPMQLWGEMDTAEMDNDEHCKETLAKTCNQFSKNVHLFGKLGRIVVTLNKLDCLYRDGKSGRALIKRGDYPLLDNGTLSTDHKGRIDQAMLYQIHYALTQVFASFPAGGAQNMVVKNLEKLLGCNHKNSPVITLKAISSYNWVEAEQSFMPLIGEQQSTGHRLLEPILELLGEDNYLPSNKQPEKRRGFWPWNRRVN